MKNIKKIFGYVTPYWRNLVTGVSLNLMGTIFSVFSFMMLMPFLKILFKQTEKVSEPTALKLNTESIQQNLNYFLSQILADYGEKEALLAVSITVVLFILLKTTFLYLGNFSLIPLINGIIHDIRNKIFVKILRLPIAYFSEEKRGDILLKATGDVQEVASSIIRPLRKIIKAPIQIIIYVTVLFIMSYKLTLFVLILIPLSGYLIGLIGKNLKKTSIKGQNKLGQLMSLLEETVFGLRIIKAFNSEDLINNNFKKQNRKYYRIMNKVLRKKMLAQPFSEFLSTSILVIILWYGGQQVLGDGMSAMQPSSFITYLIIFSQIIQPAKAVSSYYYNMRKGMASYERIESLLKAPITIQEKKDAKTIDNLKESIVYENVSFKYQHDYVLNNINLDIKKGETVAIVGQSGAGKSTLVNLLPRFYDVESGNILIDGTPLPDLKISSFRSLIGLVSQDSILFNDSIYSNIEFGRKNVTKEDVIHAAKVANAHKFIVEMEEGYDTNIGDQGNKLSGGQKQRLSIARAILKNPPLLILDEATSSLDTESEKLVQEALYNLMTNRTSIIIAHRLSTVRRADKIVVLHQGEIKETGNHDELIEKDGIYKKLHDMQMFT